MSTIASVSRVALKGRNAEISPRVTSAVSTGTISAAACRALSFSADAARLAAAVGLSPGAGTLAPAVVSAAAVLVAATAGALVAADAESRLQPARMNNANTPATRTVEWRTANER